MKQLMLIARHFPPEVSGGARRPYLLSKGLMELGYDLTVVTPFEALPGLNMLTVAHPVLDKMGSLDMMAQANGKVRSPDSSLRDFLRTWLLFPDPEIRWSLRVLQQLWSLKVKPDCLITTSPPESLHITGMLLSRRWGVPWVAEFRDTWIKLRTARFLRNLPALNK